MAELELAVNYRTTPAKVGLWTMTGLFPIWAMAVPFLLGLFLSQLATNPQAQFLSPVIVALVIIGLASVPALSVLLAAICEDDRILITKEGMAFPLFMLPGLRFKRTRIWSDLCAARVLCASEPGVGGSLSGLLELHFQSGGQVKADISKLNKSELEQLLLALEVWAKNCQRTPELIELQNTLQNEARGIEHVSYTQMWEEELGRRFSATSFIPLEPDRELKGGSLKIVRQLAFGGLSAIYLAQQNQKDLFVLKEAVVPANADEQSKAKAAELFAREAKFLIRLDHPQIAKVYDHFAEEGRSYLVLEYIRGQDLRQLVKQNGAQSESAVLQWSHQIASIVEYLHAQTPPIIHRDLTPDNLVRQDDESITLIDFGAANEFVGTATGTLVGKQAYIAPEQLRGKASLASDIYAIGGTMYFLLTGKDPEPLSSSHPRDLVPEISEATDALVAACTEMEAEDRPQSARELVESIARIIAHEGAASGKETVTSPN